MKLLSSVVAAAILSAILPAQGATTDPLKTIYRVPGVRDNGGGAQTGVATSFFCSNLSSVPETIRFVVRSAAGTVVGDQSFQMPSLRTVTASTHETTLFSETLVLTPGSGIIQGMAVILSTSLNVHCSAMIVDAAATVPQGIALHMVRVNPAPNTQE
jgi:hypothetical protein